MIPTREQIDEHYSVNALAWLRAMRDEIDRLTDANANLTRQVEWEQRAWPMWMEKALGKPLEGRTPSMVQVQLTKRFDAIQADLDRANTEAALARDALAKATTPAPEREAAIRAWEGCARAQEADDGSFVVWPEEITEAVALMRSAGDGKALLRELRGKYVAAGYGAKELSVRLVDEMLARPAPSHVYSRGKTIAESADPPTAYYPPPPVEIWPEEMKRQTLVGKFEPATVEQAESERDALKAKLAEAGHGGIFIPDEAMVLRAENAHLKAKLAALVEATAEVHEKLRINADGKATVTVGKAIALRRELGEALAAAKVPPDLDQLTR